MGIGSTMRADEFIPGYQKSQNSNGVITETVGFFPYTVKKLLNGVELTDIIGKLTSKNRFSYQFQLFKFESLGLRKHWEAKFTMIFQANLIYVNQSKDRDFVYITATNLMTKESVTAKLPSKFMTQDMDKRLVTLEITSRSKQFAELRPLRTMIVKACNIMREEGEDEFKIPFSLSIEFVADPKKEVVTVTKRNVYFDKVPESGITNGTETFYPVQYTIEMVLKRPDKPKKNVIYKMKKSGRMYRYDFEKYIWEELFLPMSEQESE